MHAVHKIAKTVNCKVRIYKMSYFIFYIKTLKQAEHD